MAKRDLARLSVCGFATAMASRSFCHLLLVGAIRVPNKLPPIIVGKVAIETTPNQGTGVHGHPSMIIRDDFRGRSGIRVG